MIDYLQKIHSWLCKKHSLEILKKVYTYIINLEE